MKNSNEILLNDNVVLTATKKDFPNMPGEYLNELKNRTDGIVKDFEDGEAIVHFGTTHSIQVSTKLLKKQ